MAKRARVLVGVVLLLLAACSSGGDDDADAASDGAETAATAGAEGEGGSEEASSEPVDLTAFAQSRRDVIRTAEVTVRVDDVGEAAAEAVRLAEAAGGYQAAAQLDLSSETPSGSVTLRVPSASFAGVLDAVAALGEEGDRRIGSEDVTGAVVDLEARVAATRASVERVRGFLDETGDVVQLASVEHELLSREAELQSLEAQLAGLRDQVQLSTIVARFGVEPPAAIVADPEPSEDIPAPGRALRHGWVVLVNVLKVAGAALAFALPFAVLAVPALLAGRSWRRRARRLAG